ncbi:hypothetical protein FBZ82_104102 [Azospirillum brasilense]|uniref:Uncharacterized protein n=1 Tax=Azospirillum brasilense TaxID=192 RepID=A0A560BBL5_AZOBR|nr:hypothetical protein [Azospirillum brasilense]TWA69942.1 hypothetical protein FBZ82_104102 [Azospirillum brasilense]
MPLTQQQLNTLDQYCVDNPAGVPFLGAFASPNLGIPANECACWRWTTAGLSGAVGVINDPAQAFTAIALNTPFNQGSIWENDNYAPTYVQQNNATYNQYVNNNYALLNGVTYDTWFADVTNTIVEATCRMGGLTPGAGPQTNGERYYVYMHYDRVTNGEINPPNYTHWWIGIDLGNNRVVNIEMFPGSTQVTFRFNNAYAAADNAIVEVTDLTQNHMAILNAILP